MLDAYDFSRVTTVADVGGGNGSVLRGRAAPAIPSCTACCAICPT